MAGDWADVPYIGPAYGRTSGRPDGPPVLGVLHATANTASPTGEATYARDRRDADPTSAHLYAGDADPPLVQGVPLGDCAWHAGGRFGNRRGVAIEVCGLTGWSRSTWTADMRDVRAAGRGIRIIGERTGIRSRWLDQAGFLRLYASRSLADSGWVTHAQYNAWSPDAQSDHTDPGPGLPLDLIMQIAQEGLMEYGFSVQKYGDSAAWRLDALTAGADKVRGGPATGETMWLVTAVKELTSGLAALAKAVAANQATDQATKAELDQVAANLAKLAAAPALSGQVTVAGTLTVTPPAP